MKDQAWETIFDSQASLFPGYLAIVVSRTARFIADGRVCEMTLEKRQTTDTGIVSGSTFSDQEERGLIDDVLPENERGRNLTRVLNETIDGAFTTTEYTYENALVRVYGIIHPAGAAGKRVIIITWPKRPCSEPRASGAP